MQLAEAEVGALGEHGFIVQDGWLGDEAARAVHGEIEALWRAGTLRPAGVSRGTTYRVDPASRGDAIAWLTPEVAPPGLGVLCARFDALRDALNREAWLGLARYDIQLARYPGGGAGYRRHRDAVPGRAGRRVTALYYANPGWRPADGGCLRLHLGSEPLEIAPILDRLVVFLSASVEHEVRPTFAPRVAATAWFYGPDVLPV
jgi:SM-20-related protein